MYKIQYLENVNIWILWEILWEFSIFFLFTCVLRNKVMSFFKIPDLVFDPLYLLPPELIQASLFRLMVLQVSRPKSLHTAYESVIWTFFSIQMLFPIKTAEELHCLPYFTFTLQILLQDEQEKIYLWVFFVLQMISLFLRGQRWNGKINCRSAIVNDKFQKNVF